MPKQHFEMERSWPVSQATAGGETKSPLVDSPVCGRGDSGRPKQGGMCRVRGWGCASQSFVLEWVLHGKASEQTPKDGQDFGNQGQGPRRVEASIVTEVMLAAGGGGHVLGVDIIHGIKAAGHAGLAHLHLGWGIICMCGHAVVDHGQESHRVEAVLPIVETRQAGAPWLEARGQSGGGEVNSSWSLI